MAKNIQLKDPTTKVPAYPITLSDNVYLANGSSLTEALNEKLNASEFKPELVNIFAGDLDEQGQNVSLSRPLTDFALIYIRLKWKNGYGSCAITMPATACLNYNNYDARIVGSTDSQWFAFHFPDSSHIYCDGGSYGCFTQVYGMF